MRVHNYVQSWESYFVKVIYYVLLVTLTRKVTLKLHITLFKK